MRVWAALLLLVAALPAAGDDAVDIDALIDRARSAPAEFAADALIRLAQSSRVAKDKKAGLLEEAFRRAAGAQQPLKKRAIPAARTGSPVFLGRAFGQGLDANTLQSRAVRAMLAVDARKARDLFREIPQPALAKRTCDDALVEDVSAYYETLGEVAARGFSPAEIAEEEPFKLLAGHVRGLAFAAQAGPVARMLVAARLERPQLEALVSSFTAAVAELSVDDRSFSESVSRQGAAGQAVAALAAHCARLEIPSAPVVEAWRAYLVRHFKGTRCADVGEPAGSSAFAVQPSTDEALARDPVQFFNDRMRVDPVKPLTAEDVKPAKIEGSARGLNSCESQDCRRLVALYRDLVLGAAGQPHLLEKRGDSEWQAKVKEYTAALAEWKEEAGTSAAGLFQQKCSLYNELINVLPNGADRIMALRTFLDFLEQNSVQRENRMEWFLPVNGLIARVSLDPLGLGELRRDLRSSEDPVIALYAALEEVAPRPPESRISVF